MVCSHMTKWQDGLAVTKNRKSSEHNRRWSKRMQFAQTSNAVWNPEPQLNCEWWCHNHKPLLNQIRSNRNEWSERRLSDSFLRNTKYKSLTTYCISGIWLSVTFFYFRRWKLDFGDLQYSDKETEDYSSHWLLLQLRQPVWLLVNMYSFRRRSCGVLMQ